MATKTRVIVAEDDAVANAALCARIRKATSMQLCNSVSSYKQVNELVSEGDADVLLLDLDLHGQDSTPLIAPARHAGLKVVIISVLGDEYNVMRAIREGADGYLIKDTTSVDAAAAVTDVIAGKPPLSPLVARYLLRTLQPVERSNAPTLAPREMQMLKALAAGYTYREIADQYDISYHTVVDYMRSMYRKLEVNSRNEAVITALRQGLISVDPAAD